MSKTYKLNVTEVRQYHHEVVIQVDDDVDMNSVNDKVEKMLDYTHGDLYSIGYNSGIMVTGVIKDESPDYSYKTTWYKRND